MSEELKPCPVPWCVLPSEIDIQPEHYAPHLTHGGGSPGGWAVMCGTCGCQGPRKSTRAEATAEWNKRPEEWAKDTKRLDWLHQQLEVDGSRVDPRILTQNDGVNRDGNFSRLYLWVDDSTEKMFEGLTLREAIDEAMSAEGGGK